MKVNILFDAANPVKMTEAAKPFEGNEKATKALKTAIEIAKLIRGKVFRNAKDDGFIIRSRVRWLEKGFCKYHKVNSFETLWAGNESLNDEATPVWMEWKDIYDKRFLRGWLKPYRAECWFDAAGGCSIRCRKVGEE